MTWNYRVVRKWLEPSSTYWYAIHEVYYDDEGRMWGCTETPVDIGGESAGELKDDLFMHIAAVLRDDFVDYDSIPEEGAINPCFEGEDDLG